MITLLVVPENDNNKIELNGIMCLLMFMNNYVILCKVNHKYDILSRTTSGTLT